VRRDAPAPRSVWLARHASRLDFEDSGWHRTAARPHDPPLSAAGEEEARALAERLAAEPIRHVFSSPFLRCVMTAQPVAERLGLGIAVEPGLSEWLNDAWFPEAPPELLPLADLAARAPRVDAGYRPRGAARYGESGEEALRRSADVALRLVAAFDGDLLLVGHGASVLGAAAGLLGRDPERAGEERPLPELPSACLVQLAQRPGGWTLERSADTSHLHRH
jgi:broad specificity phosphatase PhoE